ncbi:MAG TPA: sterol desaturase family protein [Blastocatellia bacterium]|nr:sterol desaturase family protein [Blastocatellia bacterium]
MKAHSGSPEQHTFPNWLAGALTVGALGVLLWLERRRPLRHATESKFTRDARNLAVAAGAGLAMSLVERPLALRLARHVTAQRLGLLNQAPLPRWLATAAGIVLLDYTLYLWHYLTHRVGFLWRCHVVHHADLDMDATTALRFHCAEMLLTVPFRLAQVRVIGVSPYALTFWQTLLFLSVLFHHSNVELPIACERQLNRFIVTPRMHGIHHSLVREETDANWSSGLTLWDWLHGTLRRDIPQPAIVIGVPAYRTPEQVTLGNVFALPFVAQPDTWQLPAGAGRPVRRALPTRAAAAPLVADDATTYEIETQTL